MRRTSFWVFSCKLLTGEMAIKLSHIKEIEAALCKSFGIFDSLVTSCMHRFLEQAESLGSSHS